MNTGFKFRRTFDNQINKHGLGALHPSHKCTGEDIVCNVEMMLSLENQYHNELQLELQGVQYSSSVSNMNKQSSVEDTEAWEESLPNMQQIAEDTTTMSKVVMSRKKRRLYEAMQIGKERKRAHVNLLKERKQKIETAQGSEKS